MPYFSSFHHVYNVIVVAPHVGKFIFERAIVHWYQRIATIKLPEFIRVANELGVQVKHSRVILELKANILKRRNLYRKSGNFWEGKKALSHIWGRACEQKPHLYELLQIKSGGEERPCIEYIWSYFFSLLQANIARGFIVNTSI